MKMLQLPTVNLSEDRMFQFDLLKGNEEFPVLIELVYRFVYE